MMEASNENSDRLSEKQLKWGAWWVEHKQLFQRIGIGALATMAFALLAYGSWGFADWFFGSGVQERAGVALLTQNLTDYTSFRESARPAPLTVQPSLVLAAGEGKYDLLSKVSNSSGRWWVEFDYRFVDQGLEDRLQHGYLLPGDSRFFYRLGLATDGRPSPTFEITEVSWHRVDGHEIRPDYVTWAGERMNFLVDDPEFMPPDQGSVLPVSRASFRVTNDSGYGYVSVPFLVTLLSGERVVGANRVVASDFKAGEMRTVEASWFHSLPGITRVEVRPELNLFDETIYLEPED